MSNSSLCTVLGLWLTEREGSTDHRDFLHMCAVKLNNTPPPPQTVFMTKASQACQRASTTTMRLNGTQLCWLADATGAEGRGGKKVGGWIHTSPLRLCGFFSQEYPFKCQEYKQCLLLASPLVYPFPLLIASSWRFALLVWAGTGSLGH